MKRADISRPSWIALPVSFFTDPDFMGRFEPNTIAVFAYVCSHAVRGQGIVDLNFRHVQAYIGLDEAVVRASIKKLVELRLVAVHVTEPSRARDVSVPLQGEQGEEGEQGAEKNSEEPTQPVVPRETQYDFEHESLGLPASSAEPTLPQLAVLWNENRSPSLAEVRLCSATRRKHALNRWREHPSREFWLEVIEGINSSSFCMGSNDRGWKADFDWLVRPGTAEKVLEGKYANKTQHAGSQAAQKGSWFKRQQEGSTQ